MEEWKIIHDKAEENEQSGAAQGVKEKFGAPGSPGHA